MSVVVSRVGSGMGLNEMAALMAAHRLKKGVLPIWMHWVTTAKADEQETMGVGASHGENLCETFSAQSKLNAHWSSDRQH